jgi:hypothetical protein
VQYFFELELPAVSLVVDVAIIRILFSVNGDGSFGGVYFEDLGGEVGGWSGSNDDLHSLFDHLKLFSFQ